MIERIQHEQEEAAITAAVEQAAWCAVAVQDASELRLQEVTKRVGHFCPSPSGC